jgi:hypothetical protein
MDDVVYAWADLRRRSLCFLYIRQVAFANATLICVHSRRISGLDWRFLIRKIVVEIIALRNCSREFMVQLLQFVLILYC